MQLQHHNRGFTVIHLCCAFPALSGFELLNVLGEKHRGAQAA